MCRATLRRAFGRESGHRRDNANTNVVDTALSVQIFGNATSPFTVQQDRAWGAALTLIAIVFIVTIAARLVTAFFARRQTA